MTKAATRSFFFAGTLVFTLVFIGLTIDTHRSADVTGSSEDPDDFPVLIPIQRSVVYYQE